MQKDQVDMPWTCDFCNSLSEGCAGYCHAVSKGSSVFLLEYAKGSAVFKVRAKAEFKGNTFVAHSDFSKHFHHHRCSLDEYNQVRKGWTVDKEGCVLWEFVVIDILDQPLYLVPKQGEVWCFKTAVVLLGHLFFSTTTLHIQSVKSFKRF